MEKQHEEGYWGRLGVIPITTSTLLELLDLPPMTSLSTYTRFGMQTEQKCVIWQQRGETSLSRYPYADLAEKLHLPSHYTIVHCGWSPAYGNAWGCVVESPLLPLIPKTRRLPLLQHEGDMEGRAS